MTPRSPDHKARILLVDDQPKNLLALDAVLASLGHELVWAYSGTEALRRLLQEEFVLVILDVHMPGMDGFETASLIRGRDRLRNLSIIFVSAQHKSDADVARGLAIRDSDYILKPFVPEILRAKVAVIVQRAMARQQTSAVA